MDIVIIIVIMFIIDFVPRDHNFREIRRDFSIRESKGRRSKTSCMNNLYRFTDILA